MGIEMGIYREFLVSKKRKVGVWGTGYIGLSTMAYFARQGIISIGTDINRKTVDTINQGMLPIRELKDWLGFDIKPLVERGLIKATTDYKELISSDILVHFVAIPTEKDGKPYFDILEDVLNKLVDLKKLDTDFPSVIIIESTLTPRASEKIVLPFFKSHGILVSTDILYGVAPRRDWFVEGNKSLEELDRVFGGTNQYTTEVMQDVLSIVCDRLHAATNHRVAEMVKSIENSYRHMEITLANQLSLAYPNENMREVLKLVGTKWNIGTFYPGFGTGGYCIPLSSRYVLQGAEKPDKLSLLQETVTTDNEINLLIARSLITRGFKNIGVLGLSYKGNLKVGILSPTIPFVKELKRHKVSVKLFDPYFTDNEIKEIVGLDTFDFPEGLKEFDAIVLTVDHKEFDQSIQQLKENIKNCKFILDNLGVWDHLNLLDMGIEYHIAGDANWLSSETERLK